MGDNIVRPDHYCEGRKYEPKDVIRDWGLNFNLGSAVKYISRAGRKGDEMEDLRKAKQFLEFEIEAVEKENRVIESLSDHSYTATRQEIREALAKKDNHGMTSNEAAAGCLKRLGCISSKNIMRGYTDDVFEGIRSFNSLYDEYKPRVNDKKVLDVFYELTDEQKKIVCCMIGNAVKYERYKALVIQDMSKKDSMTCNEAAAIGDAMAKGFEDGIKDNEENSEIKIETVNESLINGYVIGLFHRVIEFNSIPDEYKPIVIDKIAQKVLDNQWNIVRDIPTKELQDMVIDRIVEMVRNGELDLMDLSDDLYDECVRSRAGIANSVYRKALDGIRKYAADTKDMVSINFEFEVDPDIDTDTANVHVHIKNKED